MSGRILKCVIVAVAVAVASGSQLEAGAEDADGTAGTAAVGAAGSGGGNALVLRDAAGAAKAVQVGHSGDLTVGGGTVLGGSGTIDGNVSVVAGGTLSPGGNGGADGGFGTIAVGKDLILNDGAVLDIVLRDNGTAGTSYGVLRVGQTVRFPQTGTVTINLKGIPGHNVEGLDIFEVISGKVTGLDPARVQVVNGTEWGGNWVVRATNKGLTVTATERPVADSGSTPAAAPAVATAVAPAAGAATVSQTTAPAASKPLRVLFIGDSITGSSSETFVGYGRHVMAARPDWDVTIVGATTARHLLTRLQENKNAYRAYDVIYINIGLHSIRADRFEDLATFEKNLAQAADLLKSIEGPQVIWRTTNPISAGASGNRDYKLVPVYNDVAVRLMRERNIAVDDVYGYLMTYYNEDSKRGGKYIVPDGTHWSTASQRDIIAPRVIETILSSQ